MCRPRCRLRSRFAAIAALSAAAAVAAAPPGVGPATPHEERMSAVPFTLESPAFAPGGRIPRRHAYRGEGDNVSPPLVWHGVPAAARELALLCDDPDAPTPRPWVHWLVYRIPPDAAGLPEAPARRAAALDRPAGALQGKSSWDELGWGGPLPPRRHGTHRYVFRLCALDRTLELPAGATKEELLAAIEGHVLATAELVGTYSR